eukprot:1189608-Prorocentrum_minimum.AAC.2
MIFRCYIRAYVWMHKRAHVRTESTGYATRYVCAGLQTRSAQWFARALYCVSPPYKKNYERSNATTCVHTSGCTSARTYPRCTNRRCTSAGRGGLRTYSGKGACRDGGHSVCVQGTDSMRAHVAHGLWIMHIKQVFVRHDMGPFACDRALRMQGRQLLACTGRCTCRRSRCIRVHPCTVGYPCCGSSNMRV